MLSINSKLNEIHENSVKKRKTIQELLVFMREWALCEEIYAQGIERVFNKLIENRDKNEAVSGFDGVIGALALKAKRFSEVLNRDIIGTISNLLTQQNLNVRKIYIDGIKSGNFMNDVFAETATTLEAYYESIQRCNSFADKLDKESSSSKKEKYLKELFQTQRTVKKRLEAYQDSWELYNKSCKKYTKNITKVIDAYNFYDNKNKSTIENCFSVLKESFKQRNSVLQEIDLDIFDLKLLKASYLVEDLALPEIALETFLGNSPILDSTLSRYCSFFERPSLEAYNGLLESAYKTELELITQKAWVGEDLPSEDYIVFNHHIKESAGRKAFCFCINIQRNSGKFCMCEKGYLKISELLIAVLNECKRAQDIDNSKNIIVLSQTFYIKAGDGKKFLQNAIQEHSLWKNVRYWEDAINSTVFDALKNYEVNNFEQDKEKIAMNHKSLIFYQLVGYGNIMTEFGISVEDMKKLVKKYGVKYKFSKNEMNDVIEAIEDSLNRLNN